MDKKFEEQKTKDNDKNKDDFHAVLIDAVKVPFIVEDCLPTYICFLELKAKYPMHSIEKLYQRFYKSIDNSYDNPFIKLFELVNIKSYSEAYCESVGSLMNICVDKG